MATTLFTCKSTTTTPRCNFVSSFGFTSKLQTQTTHSFFQFKSPLHLSSKPLNLRSQTLPKSVSSDQNISLLNSQWTSLKSHLASGKTLYGMAFLTFSPTLAEIAGLAGYDFVLIDMEHGPGGISEALQCLRVFASTHTPVILRVPEVSAAWTMKALDLGPQGIMFPSIESVTDAETAVSYCRYPPRGVRSTAHSLVRASAYGLNNANISRTEEELLIMCQVESTVGINEIEDIAAVEGVDVIQSGPKDLSASMGYLLEPGHKKVREVIKEAERRVLDVRKKGKAVYLGGSVMQNDSPQMMKQRGYHMVLGVVDVTMFRQAAVEDVKQFKNGCTMNAANEDFRTSIENRIQELTDGYSMAL